MEVVQVVLPHKRPFTFGDEFVPFKIIKTEHRADTSRAADLHANKENAVNESRWEEEELLDVGCVDGSVNKSDTTPKSRRRVLMSSMDDKTKLAIKTRVQQLEDNHRDELQHLIEQQTLALTNLIVQLQEKGESAESVPDMLAEHQNQIRYLKLVHDTQKRRVRAGQLSSEEPTTDSEKRSTDVSASEGSEELITPLRYPVENSNEQRELHNYYGYWLTGCELEHVMRMQLTPQPRGADQIKWSKGHSSIYSVQEYTDKAYQTSIEAFPKLFKAPESFKTNIVIKALKKFISFNPAATGMISRREAVQEELTYYRLSGRDADTCLPIEQLLEELEEGHVLNKSRNFFPSAASRVPFKSFESAIYWTKKILGPKVSKEFVFPTLSQFKEAYLKGKDLGHDKWYESFHNRVLIACNNNKKELKLFMSLLATASPNCSLSQNTICALMNYRAVSQGCRPQFGSYPIRSLLNYLAGCLGRPSGNKVRCFLDNLIHPLTTPALTIDTHMQRFLLGAGHTSFNTFEYAVVEDFFRWAAQQCSIAVPHRFQSAIWVTMAGPSSFVTELKKFEKTLSFTIDPCAAPLNELKCSNVSTSLEQIMARWPTLVRSDEGMNKIIELVRSRLLDIGYLNMDPVTRIVEQASGVKVIIELMSYIPVRELDAANVKSHVSLRKNWIRRQNREALASEQKEFEEASQHLEQIQQSATKSIKHPLDAEWFERDMRLMSQWLGSAPREECNYEQLQETDHYFRTHVHFEDVGQVLKEKLQFGYFFNELAQSLMTGVNSADDRCNNLSADCGVIKQE
jgi:hypothetical protein